MSEYNPAFDTPTTPAQALAWLEKQGEPSCMTFDHRKAAAAARLLGDAMTAVNPALGSVTAELARAVRKFPTWPTDPLHAVAVLGEEFGELTKAVLQSVYEPHKVKPGEVRTEAVQTAAMALRFLQSLDAYAYTPGDQHAQESLDDAAIALMRGQSEDMVLVPRRLTYENGTKGALIGEFKETLVMRCVECDEGYVDDDVCEECGGSGEFGVKVPVSWDTLKDIHKAMVAHFHPPAAKQERDDA